MKKVYFLFLLSLATVIKAYAQCSVTITGNTTVCPGVNDTLIANVSSHGGTLYYQWANQGDLMAGQTDSFYVATVAGTYSVTIMDNASCNTTSSPITITSSLNAGLNISNDTLLTSVSGGSGSYNYSWMRNNHSLSSTNSYYVVDSVGSYNVKITDSHGCSSSLNYIVKYDTITGLVFDSGYYENAKVFLLKLNTDSTLQILDSSTAVGGAFSLKSFYPSVYVYYVPDSLLYPFHLPTFYNSSYNYSVFFNNASAINLNTNISIDFVDVIGADSGGVGIINGVITLPSNEQGRLAANLNTTAIKSVSNIKVILVDSLGNPVRVAVTNNAGDFYFSKLNYGKYKLLIDEPFYANLNPPVITLTATNYIQEGQQFVLTSKSLEKNSSITGITMYQSTMSLDVISLYPNPVNDILYISTGNQINNFTYSLNDITGTVVRNGTGEGFINVSGIDKGIYLIKIQSNSMVSYSKIVIE